MTRQEIEQQLIADNPITRIDGTEYAPGSPEYDGLLARWADAMEQELSVQARESARATLRASWASQPAWIRGPFDQHFRAAQVFLDNGDDEAAEALIRYAETPGGYVTNYDAGNGNTVNQITYFATLKQTIADGIAALPPKT